MKQPAVFSRMLNKSSHPNWFFIQCKENIVRSFLIYTFVLTCAVLAIAGEHDYPEQDFYHRSIELPLDHTQPDAGTFTLLYELSSNFDFNRPTLIFFQDAQQQYGTPGEVDKLAQEYDFFKDFNLVRYQHRGREYSYIDLKNSDGTVDWIRAYRLMSADQVVEDIERVRQDLFRDRPDAKILIYGRSGGACLALRYLAKYSDHVQRAFVRAAPHPIIMHQLGYPESQYFYQTLAEVDSTLYPKLLEVLDKKTVPGYRLFWILKAIPYASKDPGKDLGDLINALYNGDTALYEAYLGRNNFDIEDKMIPEQKMGAWEIGGALRPVEISAEYMLDPAPEFIDPFYGCLKKLCEPYLDLIATGKVEKPAFPPLEKFESINTEVFYLAGRHDHVSDYRIGIELGKVIPHYTLFIADDNHTMSMHADCCPLLRNTFFLYGPDSDELRAAKSSVSCKEWRSE